MPKLIQTRYGNLKITRWIFMFGREYLDVTAGIYYWSSSGHCWDSVEAAEYAYEKAKLQFSKPWHTVIKELK